MFLFRARALKIAATSGILFNLDWSNPYRPKLMPQNFNIYDPTLYSLSTGNDAIEISKNYSPGGHFGTLEFGAKIRNAHKFEDANDQLWNASDNSALMSQFVGSFTNPDYYDKAYAFGPTVDYGKVRSFFNSNPSFFLPDTAATVQNSFPNNYDLIERVSAGTR